MPGILGKINNCCFGINCYFAPHSPIKPYLIAITLSLNPPKLQPKMREN